MKNRETVYQLVCTEFGYGSIITWSEDKSQIESALADCQEMCPDKDYWIEEGTEYILEKCRGCGTVHADHRYDAHGVETGIWCEECYDSDKYPYRKDRYPTQETHGYGEYLENDY